MKSYLPILFCGLVFIACSPRTPQAYSEKVLSITNEVDGGFGYLYNRFIEVQNLPGRSEQSDSLMQYILFEVNDFDQRISEIIEDLERLPDYKGNSELKTEAVQYIISKQTQMLPSFNEVFEDIYKENFENQGSGMLNLASLTRNAITIERLRKRNAMVSGNYRDLPVRSRAWPGPTATSARCSTSSSLPSSTRRPSSSSLPQVR